MRPLARLSTLPPAPPGRVGWPWTEESEPLGPAMPDGRAWPTITVVIPSWNCGPFVEECLRSVLLQGYPALELIVIDGVSTDASLHVIERYAPLLSRWVSEPDGGQSAAIEKGFAGSTGALRAWLNADDSYLPGALAAVARAWTGGELELVAGQVVHFEQQTGQRRLVRQFGLELSALVRYWEGRCSFQQPGLFWTRALHRSAGPLDVDLHLAMDLDLACRMLRAGGVARLLDLPLAQYRVHAASKSSARRVEHLLEIDAVSRRHGSSVPEVDDQARRRFLVRALLGAGLHALRGASPGRAYAAVFAALRHDPRVAMSESIAFRGRQAGR